MRSIYIFLSALFGATVMAQTEYISSGPIPVGIKVYDYVNEVHIDVADISDGFDEYGLPINLILPDGCSIATFFPNITKENAPNYRISRIDKGPRRITNFNYTYMGEDVAFNGSRSYSGGQEDGFDIRFHPDTSNLAAYSERVTLKWQADEDPIIFTLFLENNEIDEREQYIDSVMNNLFSPSKMTPKSYQYWLDNGFASDLSDSGLPLFPKLPQAVGIISFITNAPNVSVTKDGEQVTYLREEKGYRDERNYYLSTDQPGTYVIELTDERIKYGKSKIIYTYTVSYSFWKQGGYYFLGALGTLLVVFFIYRVNAKRKLESTQLQKQLSEAELKAVRAQLNPHFLFNALNAIQNLVNQNQTDQANDYIVKLSKLLRTVLAQSNEVWHTLENEVNLSRLYLELENMRSPFKYQVEIDSTIDMNALVPNMILQPYLENAVIHGIQRNDADSIMLNVRQADNQLILTVKDNGKPSSTTFKEGTGMALGRNRLEIIRKQVGEAVKAGIKARSSSEKGFIVEIRLPVDL